MFELTPAARTFALRLLAEGGDPEACFTLRGLDVVAPCVRRPSEGESASVVDGVRVIFLATPRRHVLDTNADAEITPIPESDQLVFTPAAREAARALVAASPDTDACMRYDAQVGSGNISRGVHVRVDRPREWDRAYAFSGLKVVVALPSQSYLRHYLVDWSEGNRQFTLTPRAS